MKSPEAKQYLKIAGLDEDTINKDISEYMSIIQRMKTHALTLFTSTSNYVYSTHNNSNNYSLQENARYNSVNIQDSDNIVNGSEKDTIKL